MNRAFKSVFCLVTMMPMLASACSTVETPQQAQGMAAVQEPTRIQFDRPLHFSAADGSDVIVQSGSYRVERATDSQIRLVPSREGPPTLLGANAVPLDLDVAVPIALALPSEPDAYDLVLLVPSGPALEAHGSVSGVQPRGGPSRFKAILGPPLAFDVPLLPGPDLYPRSIFRAECPEPGNLVFVVVNGGADPAGPSEVQVSKGGGSVTVRTNVLASGQSQAFSVYDSCSAYGGGGEATCSATVRVDVWNEVAENNEINNSRYQIVCRH